MKFLSFLRRRWFRILAGAFFLFLLLAYVGFKYLLTESFVRSRILPMAVRGLRHDIEVDSIRGGLVSGFVAEGVRIKDPTDLGDGDHITIREARARPDWLALVRRRIVFRSIECQGVKILFRKQPDGRGNWMPDLRYPQLKGKPQADPVAIRTLTVSDLEYRFEDQASGFTTVMEVGDFAGSLDSDENVIVDLAGSWQTNGLVYGQPGKRQHIPAFACEGVVSSDTRGKRTTINVRAFKGHQQVEWTGVYDWQPGNSFVEFGLDNGIADFEGEFFRSLFPGFLPLEGTCQYSGSFYRGGGESRIHIDAFSPEARIDRPGIRNRPFRDVWHQTDFHETEASAQLVWTATGTVGAGSDLAGFVFPFETELVYSPPQGLLTVRQVDISSPGAVLDASGFVWFTEGHRPTLGLTGNGSISLGSEVGKAFYAGIPLDASLAFTAKLEGSAGEPILNVSASAPLLRVTPPWSSRRVEIPRFDIAETVEWEKEGRIQITGRVAGGEVVQATPDPDVTIYPPFAANHTILCVSPESGWNLAALDIAFPQSQVFLSYPASVSDPSAPVRFGGKGEIAELAEILSVDLPAEVEGTVSFQGKWERDRPVQDCSVLIESPRVRLATGPPVRECILDEMVISGYVLPASNGALSLAVRVSATDVTVSAPHLDQLSLGESQLLARLLLAPQARFPEIHNIRAESAGWTVEAKPPGHPENQQGSSWIVTAEGDLGELSDRFGGSWNLRGDGTVRGGVRVIETAEGITFNGEWRSESVRLGSPKSGVEVEFRNAVGKHWADYHAGRELGIRGRLLTGECLVRSGSREALLGPAEAEGSIRRLEPEDRLEIQQVQFENQRIRFDLSGETSLAESNPASHYQLDIRGPLEVLWMAATPGDATHALAPGSGDVHLVGEVWREEGEGRGSFRVTADELEIYSIAEAGSLAGGTGPHTVWHWDTDIEIGEVKYQEHVSTDHRHHLRCEGDRLWIDDSRCTIGEGELAAIATVELGTGPPRLSGALWVEGSDLAAWIPSFVADGTGAVGGIASATAVWSATGGDAAQLRRSLRARFDAGLRDGYFQRTKVTRSISSLLGLDELQNVDVYHGDAHGHVEGECLYLEKAKLTTNRYRAEIEGKLHFDGNQDFRMIINLPIPLARRIPDLGGIEKIFPKEVPIALKASGTVQEPKVSVVRYSLIERPFTAVGDAIKHLGRFFQFGSGKEEEDSGTESGP